MLRDAEELRKRVERQEREELRDDLASALRAGIGTDELGEALRRLIRQSLEEVVHQALEGERVRKVIERHVTDRILTSVAGELRDAQQELLAEARGDLAKAWRKEASAILLGSLRKEMTESVRQGIRESLKDVSFRKEVLLALREAQEEDHPEALPTAPVMEPLPSAIAEPVESLDEGRERRPLTVTYTRRWPLPLLSPFLNWLQRRPRFLMGVVVLILAGLTALLVLFRPPINSSTMTESAPALDFVHLPPDRLRGIWIERMNSPGNSFRPYFSLPEILTKYSFEDQFDCWFSPRRRPWLDDLLETSAVGDLRGDLRRAFDSCVQESYVNAPADRLPILGAQTIVLELLRRRAEEDWQECRVEHPEIRDLDGFRIDGEPGARTSELLNTYLASCTRFPLPVRIGPEATTPEYLIVLYAALKDLEGPTTP